MFGETFAIIFIILLVGGIVFAVCGYYAGWDKVLPASTTNHNLMLFSLPQPTPPTDPVMLSLAEPSPIPTVSRSSSTSSNVSYKGNWRVGIPYNMSDIVMKGNKLYISEKDNNTDVIRGESILFNQLEPKFIEANGEYGNQFTIKVPNIEVNAIRVLVNNLIDYSVNFFSLRYLNEVGLFESLYKSTIHNTVETGENKWLVSTFTEPITLPVNRPIVVTVMTRHMSIGYNAEVNKFSDVVSNITQVVIFSPRTVIPEESVYFVVEPLLKKNNWKCLE